MRPRLTWRVGLMAFITMALNWMAAGSVLADFDACGDAAASSDPNLNPQTTGKSGGGDFAECLASCKADLYYNATAKKLFSENPCQGEKVKKQCCVPRSFELCKFLAKKSKLTYPVVCKSKAGQGFEKVPSSDGACKSKDVCTVQLPECGDAVKQAVTGVTAKCAASAPSLFVDEGSKTNKIYYDLDNFLKLSKISFSCPGANKCVADVTDQKDFLCSKYGELKGVSGAVCAKSVKDDKKTCSDLALFDAKYKDYVSFLGAADDPCKFEGSAVSSECCGPPAAKEVKPGEKPKAVVKPPQVAVVGYGLINPLGARTVPQIIGQIIQWLGGLAGTAFFLYLIWGGIEWMTAGGASEKVKSAQGRIIAAVAGIVIIMLAYLIIESLLGVLVFK